MWLLILVIVLQTSGKPDVTIATAQVATLELCQKQAAEFEARKLNRGELVAHGHCISLP